LKRLVAVVGSIVANLLLWKGGIRLSSGVVLISDIHSNLEALEAVSKDMPNMSVCCTGDLVGYGASPVEVVQWVKMKGAAAVMGNHDYATCTGDIKWFNQEAATAVKWTRQHIGPEELKYLRSLPLRRVVDVGGVRILLVHGSPTDPLFEYVHPSTHEHLFNAYLTHYEAHIIAIGHTHTPFIWQGRNGYIVNPGSTGQPRTGNPEASYLVMWVDDQKVSFEHRTVAYDTKSAAEKIRKAGLPISLAERLLNGT
jgi:putative phosphoesterase